jgi:hypothetical protein
LALALHAEPSTGTLALALALALAPGFQALTEGIPDPFKPNSRPSSLTQPPHFANPPPTRSLLLAAGHRRRASKLVQAICSLGLAFAVGIPSIAENQPCCAVLRTIFPEGTVALRYSPVPILLID